MRYRRPARVQDIAREANVSTATVDRVLNGRDGVAAATADRVRRALDSLSARKPGHRTVAPDRARQFSVILPRGAGPSTEYLGEALQRMGSAAGVKVIEHLVEKMNPVALADCLASRIGSDDAGVAFQALDHPQVRDSVSKLSASGVPSLALMSGLDGSDAFGFVGVDNRSGGRTAGYLMGRFVAGAGKIAVVWGGELYRSHEQREIGFRTVLRSEFPHLTALDIVSGGDDAEGNYRAMTTVLQKYPDLVGVYSVGGGNRGIVRALEENSRSREIVLIGHNLTDITREFLLSGAMDAVIHQDMDLAARIAIDALIRRSDGQEVSLARLPVEIIVRENIPGQIRRPRHEHWS